MCTGSFIQVNSFRRLHCEVRNEWTVWTRTSVWEGCRLRNKPNNFSSGLPFTPYTSSQQAVAHSGCPLTRQIAGACHGQLIVRISIKGLSSSFGQLFYVVIPVFSPAQLLNSSFIKRVDLVRANLNTVSESHICWDGLLPGNLWKKVGIPHDRVLS